MARLNVANNEAQPSDTDMLVVTTLGLMITAASAKTFFIKEPQSVTARAGEDVTLGCQVGGRREGGRGDQEDSGCVWERDGREVTFPRARDSLAGCSLTLEPALHGDQGLYTCRTGTSSSSPALLTVTVEPGVPHIAETREGGEVEVSHGHTVSLHCESRGGRPAAELRWRRDGQLVEELDRVAEEVRRLEDGSGGWRTSSIFTFRAKDSGSISCEAVNEAAAKPRVSSPLEIRVRVKPQVELQVDGVVREGDSFEVLCKSSAYPEELVYRWFFQGSELEGVANNSILIEEISRLYDQADITCTVENEEGVSSATTRLDVRYPPSLLLQPRSQAAKRKDNVTFHCVAEGNPAPAYVWTQGRQDALLQAGQNLSLVASEETEAVYRCHVFSQGHRLVSSLPASLSLIRKPEVQTPGEKWGSLGQDVILYCSSRAVTNRTRLVWLKATSGSSPPDLDQGQDHCRHQLPRLAKSQSADHQEPHQPGLWSVRMLC